VERAELQVVDSKRAIRTLLNKQENAFSIGEGRRSGQESRFVAQDTAGHMDLHEKSGIPLDRLFQCDIGHGLESGFGGSLDMRPQHAADDDRARALDLEPIRWDHIRDRRQTRGEKSHEQKKNNPG
jgi:hypothetical protein